MKPLIPRKTEFELSLEHDRELAARGAALHKQKPLAVNIHDDKQRIRELEKVLGTCAAYLVATHNRIRPEITDEALIELIDASILKGAK